MSSATFGAPREAFSRSDEGPIAGAGGWYFAAFILLFFGVIFGFAMFDRADRQYRQIAILAAAICALPFAFLVFRAIRVLQKIGRATLTTPYESLALGHPTTATYTRPLRDGVTLESVDVRLQCEEHLTRGSGKNKKTFIEVVYDEELKPVTTPMMNELRMQIPIRIPEKGPPSINDDGAETRWIVRMRLTMRGCSNTRSSFRLDVMPVTVKR